MITINEIGSAVYGAYRLARRDPNGMTFLDRSPEGALKSFYAAALLLPIHLVLVIANNWEFFEKGPSIATWMVLDALTYIIGWTLIPALMISITHWIDRWNRFFDYVVAYNWMQVVMSVVWLPLHALRLTEAIPEELFTILGLALLAVLLVYAWFVFKVSLDIGGGLAASLVAGDYMLSLMSFQVFDTVIYGE